MTSNGSSVTTEDDVDVAEAVAVLVLVAVATNRLAATTDLSGLTVLKDNIGLGLGGGSACDWNGRSARYLCFLQRFFFLSVCLSDKQQHCVPLFLLRLTESVYCATHAFPLSFSIISFSHTLLYTFYIAQNSISYFSQVGKAKKKKRRKRKKKEKKDEKFLIT